MGSARVAAVSSPAADDADASEPAPPTTEDEATPVERFAALDTEMQCMLVHAADLALNAHPFELGELGAVLSSLALMPSLRKWETARKFCAMVSSVVYLAQVDRRRRVDAPPRVHVTRGGGRG